MNFTQAFKMAAKSISANKGRSALTMLGVIIGLAAVIIGEALFGKRGVTVGLISAVCGSVIYKLIVTFVVDIELFGTNSANLMKLMCAVIVAATFIIPAAKRTVRNRKVKKEARRNA